jgi:hypothetical protein
VTLVIDRRGVALSTSADGPPRIMPWTRIKGWRVDPWPGEKEPYGALLTYASDTNTYLFGVPGTESTALAYLVDQLSRGFLAEARGTKKPAAATPVKASTDESVAAQRRFDAVKPLLVLVLIVVLVAAVTLLLLQSAGVIHLPLLGGNGSQTPTGAARQVLRG